MTALGASGLIVAYQANSRKLPAGGGKRAAFGFAILMLAVAAVGEVAPPIANGFSWLLLVALLLGGTAVTGLLQLPSKFVSK